jgi:hypothetical protein
MLLQPGQEKTIMIAAFLLLEISSADLACYSELLLAIMTPSTGGKCQQEFLERRDLKWLRRKPSTTFMR